MLDIGSGRCALNTSKVVAPSPLPSRPSLSARAVTTVHRFCEPDTRRSSRAGQSDAVRSTTPRPPRKRTSCKTDTLPSPVIPLFCCSPAAKLSSSWMRSPHSALSFARDINSIHVTSRVFALYSLLLRRRIFVFVNFSRSRLCACALLHRRTDRPSPKAAGASSAVALQQATLRVEVRRYTISQTDAAIAVSVAHKFLNSSASKAVMAITEELWSSTKNDQVSMDLSASQLRCCLPGSLEAIVTDV